MAIVHTFTKATDIYTLGVSQNTSYVLNTICGSKLTKVEEGTILSGNSKTFNLKVDDKYRLVLSATGETDVIINFTVYHNLLNSLLLDIEHYLSCIVPDDCGNKCITKREKLYLQQNALFVKLQAFQSIYFDNISTELGNSYSNFLAVSINNDRCKFQKAINKLLNEECLYGNTFNVYELFTEFISLYYYATYFIEKNLAGQDADELEFIEDKFEIDNLIGLITENTCINFEETENIFNEVIQSSNSKPTVSNLILTVPSNLPNNLYIYTFIGTEFTNNFTDTQGDLPYRVKFFTLPIRGTFLYNGVAVTVNTPYLISNANLLVYTSTIEEAKSVYDFLIFQVSDDNLIELYSDMAQVIMNTAAYINQPISQLGDLTLNKGNRENHTYTISNFTTQLVPPYIDPEGDTLDAIRVDSLPAAGVLQLNASPVNINDIIPAASITGGLFIWVAPNTDSQASNTWNFSARDAGSLQWVD